MIYFKGGVDFPDHWRFVQAGRDAVANYWAAMAHTRKQELDGRMLRSSFLALYDGDRDLNGKLLATLVKVGLMADLGEWVEVLRYSEKNETKADIAARRSAETARKAEYRLKKQRDAQIVPSVPYHVPYGTDPGTGRGTTTGCPGSGSVSVSVDLDPERDLDLGRDPASTAVQDALESVRDLADLPEAPPALPERPGPQGARLRAVPGGRSPGSFGLEVDAWCEGVSSVTQARCVRPSGAEAAKLCAAIDALADSGDRCDVARAAGADFARTRPSSVTGWSFAGWVSGGKPRAQQRGRPRILQGPAKHGEEDWSKRLNPDDDIAL